MAKIVFFLLSTAFHYVQPITQIFLFDVENIGYTGWAKLSDTTLHFCL